MSNFDEKLKELLKKDIYLSNEYKSTVKKAIQEAIEKKENDELICNRIKKHKFIRRLSQIVAVIIIGILGITVYAQISGNINLKDMGFLKLSENYEEKKIKIDKTIENDYIKIVLSNVARDSAYMIMEYDIILKDKAISEMGQVEYDIDVGYKLGIVNKIFINESLGNVMRGNFEKISDTEYKYIQVINMMNFDESTANIKIWLDSFYIGQYLIDKGVKINKIIQMDVSLNSIDNKNTISQEQKIDDNTKIILEKVENSSFETYIRLKRVTENITLKEYESNIEYYNFIVATEDGNSIKSYCYGRDMIGRNIYKYLSDGEELVEDYSEIKNDEIVRIEDIYAIILEDQIDIGKLKVMQIKSTFFSDKTNEEEDAYKRAKWYSLEAGEKKYIEQNNKGGVFEINKITVDEDNIIFYYDKTGLFGNTSYINIRVNDGTMNYICPTKMEEKNLTGDENKIVFSRKSFMNSGLGIKDGMLDDINKLQFTILYGDVDEIIGEPLVVDIPKQQDEKTKIDNFNILDTITYKYIYKIPSRNYEEIYGIQLENRENKNKEMCFQIDYYNDIILKSIIYLMTNDEDYYIKEKNSAKQLIKEIEDVFLDKNIEYKKEQILSGDIFEGYSGNN